MSGRKSMQGKTSPISFEVFKEKLSQLKGIERPVDSMTMTRSYRSSIDDLLSSKLITEVLLTPSATTLDTLFLIGHGRIDTTTLQNALIGAL